MRGRAGFLRGWEPGFDQEAEERWGGGKEGAGAGDDLNMKMI